MSKTYTNRGNCARAAKAALGKDKKAGTDFTITGSGNAFQWHPANGSHASSETDTTPSPASAKVLKTKRPPKTKKVAKPKRKKGDAKLEDQPQMKKIIAMVSRKDGATVADIADRLGGLEEHTVRSSISRLLNQCSLPITTTRTGRKVVYHLEEKGA